MKFRISPLIIPLAVFAAVNGSWKIFACAYAMMTLHECAHLAAALCIGLKPDVFALSPFGAHLTLKNKIVRSLSDEIILYAAGPLTNGVLAIICVRLGQRGLYGMNLALMLMNLLPVMPLDGGVIFKRILSRSIGKKRAERVLMSISIACALLFLAAALSELVRGRINIAVFTMALFFFGNAVTGRELYNVDFIKGISSKKKSSRVRLVAVDAEHTLLDAAESISDAYTTAALIRTGDGCKILSEDEIISRCSAM